MAAVNDPGELLQELQVGSTHAKRLAATRSIPTPSTPWFTPITGGEKFTISGSGLPGHPVTDRHLAELGFAGHELTFDKTVMWDGGAGIEWRTPGDVPDSAGIYVFTLRTTEQLNVAYVGLTSHLWMVTKGRLPRSGGARPGDRYGKPVYAGATRQRINYLVWTEAARGRVIQHWLRPLPAEAVRQDEAALIVRWNLTVTGWNRQV